MVLALAQLTTPLALWDLIVAEPIGFLYGFGGYVLPSGQMSFWLAAHLAP
ncbi:hypothetical protein AB4Z01_03240 [Inquilinus sp. YAF38]